MYRNILVPLDTSHFAERAIAPAAELATVEGAQLTLVSVTSVDDTASYLHEVAARLTTPPTVMVTDDDDPGAAIAALATPDTLLSMATHGRTGVRRAILGSVTEGVLRQVREPMLLTGPFAWRQLPIVGGRLLVCLDGSERSEMILPVATAWAKSFGMDVWLAAVVSPSVSERRREVGEDVLESGYLARVAHDIQASGAAVDWDVLHARRPTERLVELAARLPAAVVAMTTHGRTGMSRLALGSVAMGVVHEAEGPVLLVRSV